MCYMQNSFNFDIILPYVIALTPMKPPLIADFCLVLHSYYIYKACYSKCHTLLRMACKQPF